MTSRRARAIRAIVAKDVRVAFASKAVLVPFIVVPILFTVGLPLLFALIAPAASDRGGALVRQLGDLSPTLLASVEGLDSPQKVVVLGLVYLLAPLLLVVPLMVASVLAADSFAGEKERKTLEALIYSPVSDRDLLAAKMLSAWLPAVTLGLGAFVLYCLTANVAAWPVMGRLFLPTWMWVVLASWVMPAAAAVGLGATVLVSARVSTFQEAYQLGGVVVLPVVALVVAQALGVIYLSVWLVAALGLALWLVAAALLWAGALRFRRAEMIARL